MRAHCRGPRQACTQARGGSVRVTNTKEINMLWTIRDWQQLAPLLIAARILPNDARRLGSTNKPAEMGVCELLGKDEHHSTIHKFRPRGHTE
jgi:hypothetical protein